MNMLVPIKAFSLYFLPSIALQMRVTMFLLVLMMGQRWDLYLQLFLVPMVAMLTYTQQLMALPFVKFLINPAAVLQNSNNR